LFAAERAHDLVILAGPTHEDTSPIYYHAGSLGPLKEILLPPGQHAQFIKIQINDTLPEYLHLCEVEIYGTYSQKGNITFYDKCISFSYNKYHVSCFFSKFHLTYY
jgi:hypothetical protein